MTDILFSLYIFFLLFSFFAQLKSGKEKNRSRANSSVSLAPQSSAWQDKMEKEVTSLKNVVQSLEKGQKDILEFMKDHCQSDDDDEYEA